MMLFLLMAIFTIVVSCFIHDRIRNRRLYKLSSRFRGPTPLPLLGNSKDFAAAGDSHGIFMALLGYVEKYERFFRVWNGGKLYLFSYDYKDAEVILGSNTHIKKSESYKFIHPWIGENVLTGSGALWRSHRKVITPAFHFKILLDFVEVFNRKAEIYCKILDEKSGKGPFNIYDDLKLLALDNIYETAMGMNMDVQKNADSDYVRAVNDMCHVANQRFYKVWLMIDAVFKLSSYAKIQENALKILHRTTDAVIKRKLEEKSRRKISERSDDDAEICANKKHAFLDLLLCSKAAANWSEREFRQEVDTILFAGHDTVSSGLAFTLYCIAQHPEVQEKVYEEQMKIFGTTHRLPTSEDLHEMKYLERVIKETQRMYPSVPIVARHLEDDLELPGGVLIPEGTQLNIIIHAIHRDPRIWKNPNDFNPDNFLPEAIQSRPPYSFIPFSAGPRNCLGQKYAMLEMKSTIAVLCRKFKFFPDDTELLLAAEITLVSKTGIRLRVERRITESQCFSSHSSKRSQLAPSKLDSPI